MTPKPKKTKETILFANIDYCETHNLLYVVDCAYCLIMRRKAPVTNLGDQSKNCLKCGYDHDHKTEANKEYYCA